MNAGLAMLAPAGNMWFCEPVVHTSFLNFCKKADVDLVQQSKSISGYETGKQLELAIAYSLMQNTNPFVECEGINIPKDIQLKNKQYMGILVNAKVTNPLIQFDQFGKEGKQQCWIGMMEDQAGPDILASPFIISAKHYNRSVEAKECKKAIRTTHPLRFYTKSGEKGNEELGKLYPDKKCGDPHQYTKLHNEVVHSVQSWTKPIVRIRVELPNAASDIIPKQHFQFATIWKEGENTDDTNKRKDYLVYVDKDNLQSVFPRVANHFLKK